MLNHPWDVTPREAQEIQKCLAPQVVRENRLGEVAHVAGIDVGFEENGAVTRAAAAVLGFPDLTLVESAIARRPTAFPYVPGLLSFREIPTVLDALDRLTKQPDLLLCDGQGLAHPRRLGIACHVGLLTGLPAIGVGKSRLLGRHGEVPREKGSWVTLEEGEEIIGAVVRTRTGVKPLYVSIGHRVDLETAIRYVLACTPRYRLPETTRQADRLASGK